MHGPTPLGPVKRVDQPGIGRDGDDPVTALTGHPGAAFSGHGDVNRRRAGRALEQAQILHPPVLAPDVDVSASPHLADHVDGLPQALPALAGGWPALSERLLIEPLPSADPQEEPALEKDGRCRRGVSDGDRMGAVDHRRDARADFQCISSLGDRADRRPHVTGVRLRTHPRQEVVGDHHRPEAGALGEDCLIDELAGIVLLTREPPTQRARRGQTCSSAVTTRPMRTPFTAVTKT